MKLFFSISFPIVLIFQAAVAQPFQFKHHFVDQYLPGGSWGQTAMVDIDNDGDLDFITGQRGGDIRWYEFEPGPVWTMHVLGIESPSDVGGAALDVDRDGRVDFIAGGTWYRQPGAPVIETGTAPVDTGDVLLRIDPSTGSPEQSTMTVEPYPSTESAAGPTQLWTPYVFDAQLKAVHDIVLADIDGDGLTDVLTMSDQNDLRWYKIPDDPTRPWTFTRIYDPVHAGISAGDLDGDGDIDVVRSEIWLENIDNGKTWKEHAFCGFPWANRKELPFYYKATKSQVADINRDGRNDIVLTEAEFPGARVAWFEAPEDPYHTPWLAYVIPQQGGDRGPFHSLQVADFDLDGDLDIFSAEMETYGVAPHQWYIWENQDGAGNRFVEHVILDRQLGGHEAVCGDVDGDGDLDILGKLWNPVPANGNEGRNHVDYLENLSK